MKICGSCNKVLGRHQYKYCSNKCQFEFQYKNYISNWKNGLAISTKNISAHLKRYLMEKAGNKCMQCGWNKTNPITEKSALEVDHIDGNSDNNKEDNLRLICPNCHSLTANYKNLNRGSGRKWRMERYVKF
ncbi:MAG: HNH endonuclease signature motif containing protein [Parcubacteria group bacterium]